MLSVTQRLSSNVCKLIAVFIASLTIFIGQAQTCTISLEGCPTSVSECAEGPDGNVVSWPIPQFGIDCGDGSNGYAFQQEFNLPESQSADGCWYYDVVQRIGSNNANLFQSNNTLPNLPNSNILSPIFYFYSATAVSIGVHAVNNIGMNVYYDPNTPDDPSDDILGYSTTIVPTVPTSVQTVNFTMPAPPTNGEYRLRFEFIGSDNANYVDFIYVNAILAQGCSGGVNFTVVQTSNPEKAPGDYYGPGDQFPIGTTTITYTAILRNTDGTVSQTRTCEFTITIVDCVPTITCPVPSNPYSADAGKCSKTLSLVATATGDPAVQPITIHYFINYGTPQQQSINPVNYEYPVGTTEVTAIAIGSNEVESVPCSFEIIVNDNERPQITCSSIAPIHVEANSSCKGLVPDLTALVRANSSDNCKVGNALTVTQNPASGTLLNASSSPYNITVSVSDGTNTSETCDIPFYVDDVSKPIINCVAIAEIVVNANSSCSALVPDVRELVLANTSDNCSGVSILTVTQSPAANTPVTASSTPYTITVTVSDGVNISEPCEISFRVNDNTEPRINCSGLTELSANANASCQAAVPDVTSLVRAQATDNCTPSGILIVNQSPAAGTLLPASSTAYVITVTVTDAFGNVSASCPINFSVNDVSAPVINCEALGTLSADASASCQALIPDVTNLVKANTTDNCVAAVNLTVTQTPAAGTAVAASTTPYQIVVSVSDGTNVSASCSIPFTVSDITNPTVNCPSSPITLSAGVSCTANLPSGFTGANGTDNCGTVEIVYAIGSQSGNLAWLKGFAFPLGTTQVNVTATSSSGTTGHTTVTCSFDVVVIDETRPVLTCPVVASLYPTDPNQCFATVNLNFNATDCNTPITYLYTINGNPVGSINGYHYPVGATVVTIQARDAAGNLSSNTCSVTINVYDAQPPTINCPRDIEVLNNGNCDGVLLNLTPPSFSDNCVSTTVEIIGVRDDGKALNAYFPIGTTTITWTMYATDGEVLGTCEQKIIVEDGYLLVNYWFESSIARTDYPVAANETYTGVASNVTVDSETNGEHVKIQNPGAITTDQAFKFNVSRDPALEMTNSRSNEPNEKYFQFEVSGAVLSEFRGYHLYFQAERLPFGAESLAVMYSVDGVTWKSIGTNVLPIQNVFYDIVYDLSGISELYDTDLFYIRIYPRNAGDPNALRLKIDNFQIKADNRTFSVICPADVTLDANANCVANYTMPTATVTPICIYTLASVRSDGMPMSSPWPLGTTTVTWTATDRFGLSLSCTTKVTVRDITRPVITSCGAAVEVIVDGTSTDCKGAVPIVTAGVIASDNCTAASALSITQSPEAGSMVGLGTHNITVTVTDASGNSNTCTIPVTVKARPNAVDNNYGTVERPLPQSGNLVIGNVLNNDEFCGNATLENLTLTVVSTCADSDVYLDPSTGNVVVTTNADLGTCTIVYRICSKLHPTLCDEATVTVVIDRNLPVTGLQLVGRRVGDHNRLDWSTISEQNTSHFVLERSIDSRNWNVVTSNERVPAAGNSTLKRNYTGWDMNVRSEVVYYRVRLVDQNGKVTMSNVVAIRSGNNGKLRVYPNPVYDFVTVEFGAEGTYQIELFGVNGQLVMIKREVVVSAGMRTITLQRGNLAPGNYQMRITNRKTGISEIVRLLYQVRQ